MNIRSMSARLNRIERKMSAATSEVFYASLNEDELQAFIDALSLPFSKQAEKLAFDLDWPIQRARSVLDEARRLSARELIGWSEDKLRQYLEDAAAVDPNLHKQFAAWLEEDDNEL